MFSIRRWKVAAAFPEAEWHALKLIMSVRSGERGLLRILFFHTDLMESICEIKHVKLFGATELVEDLEDARKWLHIWDRFFV